MRLTTKGRFAVTALLDLALQRSNHPVTLADISQRQKISLSSELVDSVRGPGGGYCLAKNLNEVSIADIILAVDEPIDATQCGGKENCHNDSKCMTHDLWAKLNEIIFDYLGAVTLQELVDNQKNIKTKANIAPLIDMRETTIA